MIAAASGPMGFACAFALLFALLVFTVAVALGRGAAVLLFVLFVIAAVILGSTLSAVRA